ncbi:hypothetical protein [Sphingopyxis macrogoltabida]|uniref:Right handed beta helix domain-containing protein n=1 Tax=Sphingopyxis macrogoltabida TaxID=33050 RepID=A0A0N9UGM8_SPHMC|nr:hypothetical protein [Sphingopyxis macrogoltabida]ALH82901.1 hypothetical protein AN936_21845 [Sphingopyxis macrogoltabida]
MAIDTTDSFSGPFLTNGATTVFPFTFTAPSSAEVAVVLDDVEVSGGFIVAVAPGGGGSVTFAEPPATGKTLFVLLEPDFTQPIQFENGSPWLAEPVNETADRAALRDIWLKGRADRALLVPFGETGLDLPDLASRKGKLLGFDAATGAPSLTVVADTIAAAVGAVQAELDDELAQSEQNKELSQAAAAASALSAAAAEAAAGPSYPNPAAGLDKTSDGEAFAVDNGDGTVTVYLNNGGVAVAQRTLATTAALASAAGADKVGMQQEGSGAVLRTVREELRGLSISPKQFGALATVIANDRLPIQRAANFATLTGRRLDLQGLTYLCSDAPLAISCDVEGGGGKIIGQFDITGSNVVVRNFTVESTQAVYGLFVHGMSSGFLSDIVIDDVIVEMGSGTTEAFRLGLIATYVDRLTIRGGLIRYGAQITACADYQMVGVRLDGEWKNMNELLHASVKSWGVVTGCTFTRSKDNFVDLYSSGAKTVITGNRFIGCRCVFGTAFEIKISFSDNPDNTSGDANGYAEQIIFADNYVGGVEFSSSVTTSIIAIYHNESRASPPAFTWADAPRNIKISNNIFDGFDGTNQGAALMLGIYCYRVTALDIHGNTFRNMSKGATGDDFSSCVWVQDCKDVTLIGNRGAMKDGCGVSFHGACEDISSHANHWLTDQRTGYSNKYGIVLQKYGSIADPTLTRASFIGDKVFGTVMAFRQTYHAASMLTGVTFANCDFQEESLFSRFTRCKWFGNDFRASAGKSAAATVGSLNAISSFVTFLGNTTHSTTNIGVIFYRTRIGNIKDGQAFGASAGIYLFGSGVAGELDYLNIRDNFSFAQSHADFPRLSSVHATDSGTHQSSNNQKVAA